MKTTTFFRSIIAMLLVVFMLVSVVACADPAQQGSNETNKATEKTTDDQGNDVTPGDDDNKTYTYNTYLTLSPSNWNELTYQDNNDTEVMSWIGSSFFTYDFKYDADGEILPGEFEIEYSAATKLEDVSDKVDAKWGVPAGEKGYAWKITLRDDLKWEDGTAIKAEDFVYTMSEQLNPLFQNYRADSFYVGSTIIVNAQEYVKQGQTIDLLDNGVAGIYAMADLVKGDDGVYTQPDGAAVYFAMTTPLDCCGGKTVTQYKAYLDADAFAALEALADENGMVKVTDETIALWTKLIDTDNWGHETPEQLPSYLVYPYTYPEMDFSEVGIYVGDNEYEIILVLAQALPLLKEDGTLSYKAAYNMSSLPLVNKTLYEACKVKPTEGSDLWTTTYHTSKEKTMSWGPYKLESFQAGTQFTLVRNDNWYGYNMEENKGLYQTDRIVYDIVEDWNSAWVKFQKGEIDGISIDVSIADEYKGSDQAYFTPSDFVSSLQLQSSVEALKQREEEGINKSILGYTEFRKALSLAINRADFTATCTTSSKAGFGLYNSMHYYDVANGGVFRNTDEAKKVLCEVYAVDYTKYPTLDDAVAAITGYDLAAARALVTEAYNAALTAGDIKATDTVKLTFGTGSITEAAQRQYDYIANAWKELVKTTPLEGRLEVELVDKGTTWANDFRAGGYDVCMGGWSGAAWDPGYFLLAYLSPAYMYSAAWDTASVEMTFTMKGVGENGADITETMALIDWYNCLNGASSAKYDWSSNKLEESQRLQLIAALEKEVLKVYYTVPLANSFSASLMSYQTDYVTYEYNTFMGYGGVKYMTYNYDDAAWAAEVAKVNGQLNYK